MMGSTAEGIPFQQQADAKKFIFNAPSVERVCKIARSHTVDISQSTSSWRLFVAGKVFKLSAAEFIQDILSAPDAATEILARPQPQRPVTHMDVQIEHDFAE